MSGKVAAAVAVSLDGFVAGPGDSPQEPLGRAVNSSSPGSATAILPAGSIHG